MPRFQPEEFLRVLERHQVRYLVIGGLGATLHGSPLITRDADICPARDSDNLDRLALPTLRLLLQKIKERENPPTA